MSLLRPLALSSLALRVGLGLSLAVGAGGLLAGGCKPSDNKAAAATPQKKKAKNLPKNPWLEEVVSKAEVVVTDSQGKRVTCAWNASKKRHLCPGQKSWVYVGPQVLKVSNKDEVCVWQHPVDGGVVSTTLKGIATQPLELRHAFAGPSAGVQEAAPVDILVRIDGEERAKTQRSRKAGFDRVRLEPASEGKPGDLELQVSASHTGVAHFCWQLARLDAAKPEATAALPAGASPPGATTATPDVKAASATAPEGKQPEAAAGEGQPAAKAATSEDAAKANAASATPNKPTPVRRSILPQNRELKPRVPLKPLRAVPVEKEGR